MQKITDISYVEMAAALTKATNYSDNETVTVTQEDILMWMEGEGEGDANVVDAAILSFVGQEAFDTSYDTAQGLARADYWLAHKLGLEWAKNPICGGIDVSKL